MKSVRHTFVAAILAASSFVAVGTTPASAVSFPLCGARIVQHFDLAKGQTPESIVLSPDGTAHVAFAKARQIAEISPTGAIRVLATLPAPAGGGVNTPALGFPLTVGIDRASDGTLFFLYATGTADLTGVWSLRPGGTPQRIAPLPATSLPNGLALDQRTRTLYVAETPTGRLWAIELNGPGEVGRRRVLATVPGAPPLSAAFCDSLCVDAEGNVLVATIVITAINRDSRLLTRYCLLSPRTMPQARSRKARNSS